MRTLMLSWMVAGLLLAPAMRPAAGAAEAHPWTDDPEAAVAWLPGDEAEQAREERQRRREEEQQRREEERERLEEERERVEEMYAAGTEALDEEEWEDAVRAFDQVASAKGRRADAALYWMAYAHGKAGRRAEALKSLETLGRLHPRSRWLSEAKTLEVELRQASGQAPSPERVDDEDLKLIAINSLMHTDAESAVPMLEKLLTGSSSPRLKERALFVLCQSGSPRAREVVAKIARGTSSPHLQGKAIKYLGIFGGAESRQVLSDVYAGSTDVDIKKTILRAFMVAGEKGRVQAAAKGEKVPELRREAIRQLGVMGAQAEIWDLYRAETDREVKEGMIQALFVGGGAERLIELARGEKDPELRLEAIQKLGLMGAPRTAEALVALYKTETDRPVREQVIKAFFLQGNARALVDIARSEKDPELKREAVQKLSLMKSKEATQFLLEILDK